MALVELGYSGWKSYLIKFDIMELNSSTHEKPTNAKDLKYKIYPKDLNKCQRLHFLFYFWLITC